IEGFGSAGGLVPTSEPGGNVTLGARAMQGALRGAGRLQGEVDWILAHGSGLPRGDAVEVEAIRRVFGPAAANPRVSSVKGAIGHTLGASGALSAAIAVMALTESSIPPTSGLTDPDPQFDLDFVVSRPGLGALGVVVVNSFSTLGQHASLVLTRAS
ncbi:MAG TPA: beta-ketoacyl-[acyl-carrier-protein] synthase II, partial [Dehalococcoidia bacterium]|nr:beta-ketoacyl-[acyl-carrier-protein] synthase II [Dehalococcoidia bacterium]